MESITAEVVFVLKTSPSECSCHNLHPGKGCTSPCVEMRKDCEQKKQKLGITVNSDILTESRTCYTFLNFLSTSCSFDAVSGFDGTFKKRISPSPQSCNLCLEHLVSVWWTFRVVQPCTRKLRKLPVGWASKAGQSSRLICWHDISFQITTKTNTMLHECSVNKSKRANEAESCINLRVQSPNSAELFPTSKAHLFVNIYHWHAAETHPNVQDAFCPCTSWLMTGLEEANGAEL